MVDHSNMYLKAGNASKSPVYSQCLIQNHAHNRCSVSVCWMNVYMENPFGGTRLIWYQPQLVFHQALTLWSWVWGKIFNCCISKPTIRQHVYTGLMYMYLQFQESEWSVFSAMNSESWMQLASWYKFLSFRSKVCSLGLWTGLFLKAGGRP